MIKIGDSEASYEEISSKYKTNKVTEEILKKLTSSTKEYNFDSFEQLKFELDLRDNIIKSAEELFKSDFKFRTFRKAMCNEDFWKLTDDGGFMLKEDKTPSEAIKDIFIHSSKYGTECATAMVIIYYKALLNMFPEKLFDELFSGLQLFGWYSVDDDLSLRVYEKLEDYLPGDCRYVKNPDVDPLKPEWQGENVIDLGNGLYYGHGIGITSVERIIELLNERRKEDAKESAYLTDLANHPNFKLLYRKLQNYAPAIPAPEPIPTPETTPATQPEVEAEAEPIPATAPETEPQTIPPVDPQSQVQSSLEQPSVLPPESPASVSSTVPSSEPPAAAPSILSATPSTEPSTAASSHVPASETIDSVQPRIR